MWSDSGNYHPRLQPVVDPPVGACVGCAPSTYYPKDVALNGHGDVCNCGGGCEVAGHPVLGCACGEACRSAESAAACCAACVAWEAANLTCQAWFFRSADKQCFLKSCHGYKVLASSSHLISSHLTKATVPSHRTSSLF